MKRRTKSATSTSTRRRQRPFSDGCRPIRLTRVSARQSIGTRNTSMPDVRIPVVILCGGAGTRLAEQTETRPKPLVEIGGRPMVWHIMKHYARYGFTEFVLA